MATQNVQVFIRSTDVGVTNPIMIASYPESRPVSSDTHGPGMSVYILPIEAIKQPKPDDLTGPRSPTLVDNWQSMIPVSAMGTALVAEVFSVSEQLFSLHQEIESIQAYGADLSKWPAEARQRKADFAEKWKYVEAVTESVRKHAALPSHDLGSAKAWPSKPTSK